MKKFVVNVKSPICVFFLLLVSNGFSSFSQSLKSSSLPYERIGLEDLKEFEKVKGKQWGVFGGIYMDRHQKFHAQGISGNGVLLSKAGSGKNQKLVTRFEHGDMDMELDFMLSGGATGGVLLQGRYEVQLNDSWDDKGNLPAACGSVTGPDRADYSGNNAGIQACKAPGLWQHLSIHFKAPRFDQNGNKIKDAQFVEVKLNGEVIHKNLSLSGLSHSSGFNVEKTTAPLILMNEKGAIAFRNILVKKYDDSQSIGLSNIAFDVYKGMFKKYDTLSTIKPLRTGKSDSLTWRVGDRKSQLVLYGNLEVPRAGTYLFELKAGGAAWLLIDNKEILNNNSTRDYSRSFHGQVNLSTGTHPFKVIYSNSDESLVLKYEGPGIPLTLLTTPASERKVHKSEPLELIVKDKSIYQRGFATHKGKVNPYVISVGTPEGLNYSYDLSTYNILSAWKGKFIDVSNMWTERGESQMQIPLGAPVAFNKGVYISNLTDISSQWPDSVSVDESPFTERGYKISNAGLPVYQYSYKTIKLEDYIFSGADKQGITREVKVNLEQPVQGGYLLLGSGDSIEKLPNGDYAVNDKEFYIESVKGINEKQLVIDKSRKGNHRLLLPLSSVEKSLLFNYTIVW